MADLLVDGNIKISFCTTIGNIHAPTVAELGAGTSLEALITPSGYKNKSATASVDVSSLASTFTTSSVGRRSFDISLELKRQTPTDPVYAQLTYKTAGYLVVRKTTVSTTAFTTGQTVEVFPVMCGQRQEADPAPNEVQKYTVPMMVTSDPDDGATVA